MLEAKFDASYYRTKWLAAHNCLHEIAHDEQSTDSAKIKTLWNEYLADIQHADEVSAKAA
jgi:hypothetical protein